MGRIDNLISSALPGSAKEMALKEIKDAETEDFTDLKEKYQSLMSQAVEADSAAAQG